MADLSMRSAYFMQSPLGICLLLKLLLSDKTPSGSSPPLASPVITWIKELKMKSKPPPSIKHRIRFIHQRFSSVTLLQQTFCGDEFGCPIKNKAPVISRIAL